MGRKKKKAVQPNPTCMSQSNAYKSAWKAQSRASAREIGDIPNIVNSKRRKSCENDPVKFMQTYFPQDFYLPLSNAHLAMIQSGKEVIEHGGQVVYAIPRGYGKTTISICLAIWAILYGRKKFGVIVADNSSMAKKLIERISAYLAYNDLLLEDFPEVCYAIKKVAESPQKARSLTHKGQAIPFVWSGQSRQIPPIQGSISGGAMLTAVGIEGSIRGGNVQIQGQSMRPDFVLIDDPQSRTVASSQKKVERRLSIIHSDIMGLDSANAKISIFACVTIIKKGDVAEQLTNNERYLQWIKFKLPAVLKWHTEKAQPMWDKYKELLLTSRQKNKEAEPKEARDFYLQNKEDMDTGTEVLWEDFKYKGQVSNYQWAMEKLIEIGDIIFSVKRINPNIFFFNAFQLS